MRKLSVLRTLMSACKPPALTFPRGIANAGRTGRCTEPNCWVNSRISTIITQLIAPAHHRIEFTHARLHAYIQPRTHICARAPRPNRLTSPLPLRPLCVGALLCDTEHSAAQRSAVQPSAHSAQRSMSTMVCSAARHRFEQCVLHCTAPGCMMSLTVARAVPFLWRTRTIRDDSIERRTRGRCSRHRLARWWWRRRLLLVVAAATGLGDGVQRGQRALEVAQREHVAPYRVHPAAAASTVHNNALCRVLRKMRRDRTAPHVTYNRIQPPTARRNRVGADSPTETIGRMAPMDRWHRPGGTGTRTRIDSASAATRKWPRV